MKFDDLFSLKWEALFKQLPKQPEANAYRLSDVLDHLLSDVICNQVLPDAVEHVSKTFGISFSFKPRVITTPSGPGLDIVLSCSHPTRSDVRLTYDGPGVGLFHLADVDSMPNGTLCQCMMQLSLLHNIFSCSSLSANHVWKMHISYDCDSMKSRCPLVDVSAIASNIRFDFQLKPVDCLEDLLSCLITDGYDLTSLKPFLKI